MSFDPLTEVPLSLTEAARLSCMPRRRGGKRPNVATLYRWTTIGCKGVILESVQVGGTRCTSTEALRRFFAALTAQAGADRSTPAPREVSRDRQRQIAAADARLRAAGI